MLCLYIVQSLSVRKLASPNLYIPLWKLWLSARLLVCDWSSIRSLASASIWVESKDLGHVVTVNSDGVMCHGLSSWEYSYGTGKIGVPFCCPPYHLAGLLKVNNIQPSGGHTLTGIDSQFCRSQYQVVHYIFAVKPVVVGIYLVIGRCVYVVCPACRDVGDVACPCWWENNGAWSSSFPPNYPMCNFCCPFWPSFLSFRIVEAYFSGFLFFDESGFLGELLFQFYIKIVLMIRCPRFGLGLRGVFRKAGRRWW